jgi:hypothetical protein
MSKLRYGKGYAKFFFLFIGIVIFLGFIFGKLASGLAFSLTIFYLGILQLYSGVSLNRAWVAKYTKQAHPVIFYVSTALCFVIGFFIFLASFGN